MMNKKIINQKFYKYVIPSMITMLLSGFYSIIDGLFVANAVNDSALAAINIAYPIQVILNATAIGIGIGGAVSYSYYNGQNKTKQMHKTIGVTCSLLLISGIILPIILNYFVNNLLVFLGAKGNIYNGAYEYIHVILIGGILPIIGNGINPLLRNQGKTIYATISMSSGLIVNIILDYLFVYKMQLGLHGAALATIIAQGVVAFSGTMMLIYFKLKELSLIDYIPNLITTKKILTIGISPFGQTLIPCIITVITNWMCIRYGGDNALTIFSIISYVLSSIQLFLQGIGDGIQPLLSYYHGCKQPQLIKYIYKKAITLSLAISTTLTILVIIFPNILTSLFNVDNIIYHECRNALIITALSFPFIGNNRLSCALFYATERTLFSSIIVYLEPCVIIPGCLIYFSNIFKLTGIWLAYPIAQVILTIIALYFIYFILFKAKNVNVTVDTEYSI